MKYSMSFQKNMTVIIPDIVPRLAEIRRFQTNAAPFELFLNVSKYPFRDMLPLSVVVTLACILVPGLKAPSNFPPF